MKFSSQGHFKNMGSVEENVHHSLFVKAAGRDMRAPPGM